MFEGQMKSVRALVLLSANCRKPQQEELINLIEALNRGVEDMGNARNGDKKERDWFPHLGFVAEGGPVVGWVQTVRTYTIQPCHSVITPAFTVETRDICRRY